MGKLFEGHVGMSCFCFSSIKGCKKWNDIDIHINLNINIYKHQYSIDEFVARGHIFVSSLSLFATCDSSKSLKRVVNAKIRHELLNLVLIRIGVSESLTFLGQQLMLLRMMTRVQDDSCSI